MTMPTQTFSHLSWSMLQDGRRKTGDDQTTSFSFGTTRSIHFENLNFWSSKKGHKQDENKGFRKVSIKVRPRRRKRREQIEQAHLLHTFPSLSPTMSSQQAAAAAALCNKEIERLHRFWVDWFTGQLEESPNVLEEHATGRFSDDFSMVNPLGRLVSKPQLVIGLNHAYNTHPADFEIHIHNVQVLQNLTEDLKLVSYEEWQRTGNKTTARRSTALLRIVEETTIEWKWVHETWLEGKGPNDDEVAATTPTTKSTPAATAATGSRSLISPRRHVTDKMSTFGATPIMKDHEMVGLDFRNVAIQTTQGPMANEGWLDTTTSDLEEQCQYSSNNNARRRRLNLPEVCFSQAAVALSLGEDITLQWTALDALEEWSKAHQAIEIGSDAASNGVSVLKSVDAALWSNKAVQTDFHYDWTYCTPFSVKLEGEATWKPLESSGMNIDLLKDTTQPILYFDDIELFEDDLHDNGVVNLRIKLRVMPTCLYVLSRCWLRVDGLLLRSRETRVMVEFDESQRIYRDVSWRECAWKDLPGWGLPTDVRAWQNEGSSVETPAWQALVNRLPRVETLPEAVEAHCVLEIQEGMKT